MEDDQERDLEQLTWMVRDLLNRVQRLEQKAGIESQSTIPQASPANANMVPMPPSSPARPMPASSAPAASALESRIGSQWLNRVGIVALLFGVSFFLKYAVENRWLGPLGRVSAGLLFGIAIMVWSEWFRARGYHVFSFSLKAVATGVLYLSLWAAFQLYALVPLGMAFTAMVLVTAITAAFAFSQRAEVLALIALIGGFATPLLLSTGQNREVELFAYLAVLDCATLLLIVARDWQRLLLAILTGSMILYFSWYATYYRRNALGLTLAFATTLFVIFAVAPVVMPRFTEKQSRALLYVAVINAGLYFVQAFLLLRPLGNAAPAYCAVALAGSYGTLGWRLSAPRNNSRLRDSHVAVSVAFVAIALAIRFTSHWVTIGWFLLAATLMAVGFAYGSSLFRWLGLALLAAAAVKVFAFDVWRLERGYRIVSFVLLGALLLLISFLYQRDWLPVVGPRNSGGPFKGQANHQR